MIPQEPFPSRYSEEGLFASLKDGKTYYQWIKPTKDEHKDQGTTEVVVLVHGLTWWNFVWDPIVPFFHSRGHSVLTFDLYGRGRSDAPGVASYNVDFYVEQTRELIEKVLGNQKVILCGMSMGGAITGVFTSKYPQMVSKAILMCPAGIQVPLPGIVSFLSIPLIGWLGFKYAGKSSLIEQTKRDRFKENFHQFQKCLDSGLIDELEQNVLWLFEKPGFLDCLFYTLSNFEWNTLLPVYEGIKADIPVLLLWGDNDVVCQGSEQFLKMVPHAKYGELKNCGHAFLYEDSPQAEIFISQFLDNHSN